MSDVGGTKTLNNKKRIRIGACILLTLLLAIGIGITTIYDSFSKNIRGQRIDAKTKAALEEQNKKNPYSKIDGITNILLIGNDKRDGEGDNGHSDALFVATIDTIHNKLKLTSINRDSYVQNLKNGVNRKITDVLAIYGIGDLEYAVQENFGVKIDGYIQVDFSGLMDIVDALDGVDVDMTYVYNNPTVLDELNLFIQNPADDQPFKESDFITSPGIQTIDGTQALAFSRIRHSDSGFHRIERQEQVVMAIIEKVQNTSVLDYPKVLSTVSNYIETDIETKKLLSLAYTASQIKNNNSMQIASDENNSLNSDETTETSDGASLGNSGIGTANLPYEGLYMDDSIYSQDNFISSKNGAWNLPFDVEQNKMFFQDFIYNDIIFDSSKIDTDQVTEEMYKYIYGEI